MEGWTNSSQVMQILEHVFNTKLVWLRAQALNHSAIHFFLGGKAQVSFLTFNVQEFHPFRDAHTLWFLDLLCLDSDLLGSIQCPTALQEQPSSRCCFCNSVSLRGATPILFSWAPDLPLGSSQLPPLPWPPQPTVNSSSCDFYSLHCGRDPNLCEFFKNGFSRALSKTSSIYWWNVPQEGRNQEGPSQTQEEIVSTEKTWEKKNLKFY